jgi:hypothetical protein
MALQDWAKRTLAKPSATAENAAPDPHAIATIVLTAEGTTLETWSAPFADSETFVLEAQAVIAEFAEDFPKRRIPLLFTASNAAGELKTQCPSSVMGKNVNTDALLGGGSSAPKAFADGMAGISAVMNSVLKAAKDMIDTQQAIIKSKDEQIHAFAEYFRVKQEVEATEAKTSSDTNTYLMDQLKTVLPLGLQAAEVFIEERKQSLGKAVAKAAVNAVSPATNPSNGAITS